MIRKPTNMVSKPDCGGSTRSADSVTPLVIGGTALKTPRWLLIRLLLLTFIQCLALRHMYIYTK